MRCASRVLGRCSVGDVGRYVSPLRYPGGKARMGPYLAELIEYQDSPLDVEVWVEPFAGGLGAGLHVLSSGAAEELWFCEANVALAAMWLAILGDVEGFAARVEAIVPSMSAFYAAREHIGAVGCVPDDEQAIVELGLSAFVVNRCSRSGIVSPIVGPIGGKHQRGRHHVASRFHPDRLAARIRGLGELVGRMKFQGPDGIDVVESLDGGVGFEDEVLIFADPPYVDVGNTLYSNGMDASTHLRLAWALNTSPARWALTYDSTESIMREWYPHRRVLEFGIRHGANLAHADTEYLICSDNLGVDPGRAPIPGKGAAWLRWGDALPHGSEQSTLSPLFAELAHA